MSAEIVLRIVIGLSLLGGVYGAFIRFKDTRGELDETLGGFFLGSFFTLAWSGGTYAIIRAIHFVIFGSAA